MMRRTLKCCNVIYVGGGVVLCWLFWCEREFYSSEFFLQVHLWRLVLLVGWVGVVWDGRTVRRSYTRWASTSSAVVQSCIVTHCCILMQYSVFVCAYFCICIVYLQYLYCVLFVCCICALYCSAEQCAVGVKKEEAQSCNQFGGLVHTVIFSSMIRNPEKN